MFTYLKFPILSLVLGLLLAAALSWMQHPNLASLFQSLLTVSLLCVLEISLSFDNAVVNATVIKKMDEKWKKRFLLWGMLIAVFGMRFLFPIIIVSIAGGISLADSVIMALQRPDQYAAMMIDAHLAVSSYGGAFLLMVALHFFLNAKKDNHWFPVIEGPFAKFATVKSSEIMLALIIILVIYKFMEPADQSSFITSALYGIVTYLVVHGLSELLGDEKMKSVKWMSSGLGLFLYLEVLDASFSFDGVIGAFAITKQLYEIMIGLGVGAFFVRGLTLYLVDHEKLDQYQYLEHGAFYALAALALFMLLDHFFHFPEWITALTGAAILAGSIFGSIYENRQERASHNQDNT